MAAIALIVIIAIFARPRYATGALRPSAPPVCTFNNSIPDTLALSCVDAYTLTLDAGNGALTGVYTASGAMVSPGSRNGCLWGMSGPGGSYCGSCGCMGVIMRMAVQWSSAASNGARTNSSLVVPPGAGGVLQLTYTPEPAESAGITAVVTVTLWSSAVDLTFMLVRPPALGDGYFWLLFPSEILVNAAGLSGMYVPVLPGVMLNPDFFSAGRSYSWQYPGNGGFAGWVHATTANGSLAVYDLSGPDAIAPYTTTLAPAGGSLPASLYYLGVYHVINATTGCSPTNNSTQPCALGINGTLTRRLAIGPATLTPVQTIRQYAFDNGMLSTATGTKWAVGPYPTLRSKLTSVGAAFWQQVYQAPLMKLDAVHLGLPFPSYSALYEALGIPVLLHYVAFEPGGFDRNYPDMLPPAAAFGTTCDLQATMLQAATIGHITMPYFNPTWWDPASPTLANLSSLVSVAALNSTLQPYYETYDVDPRTGVATCPHAPFVQNRIAQELSRLSWNGTGTSSAVGAACNDSTASLPSTFVFEDQLAARWPHEDFSPYEHGMSYAGYVAGWQQHMIAHASNGLHTEQGVDRMARVALGFHGSVLSMVSAGSSNTTWGDNTWEPVPLFAAAWRDRVMHFQHNLDGSAMAADYPFLCWSLAMGMHLSADLGPTPRNFTWLATVATMQRLVVSRYADYVLTRYDSSGPLRTSSFAGTPLETTFSPSYTAIWNALGNAAQASVPMPYAQRLPSILPGGGCMMYGSKCDAVAGVYTATYNNATLATGMHVLIEDRTCVLPFSSTAPAVCVYQPFGQDSPITVGVPAPLVGGNVGVWALKAGLVPIGAAPFTASRNADYVTFVWASSFSGENVTAYAVGAVSN